MHPIIRAAGCAALILLVLLVGVLGGRLLNPEPPLEPAPVPVCTDELADAGAVCMGVPEWERVQLPACPTEDAAGPCVWDAQTQGNGRGHSFWVDAAGVVHPLEIPSPITR